MPYKNAKEAVTLTYFHGYKNNTSFTHRIIITPSQITCDRILGAAYSRA
jgi:hypothetical protein